ncbi:MAG: TetR/AcrR family transcriptional regulator [Anaerolineales bacterium]|jgi:AcrR family transcriptional regulator
MQKKNKIDRRVQRTRKALRSALLELIKEKGYDSISVEEITQRANLGRATFYLHYKDKEDLLVDEFSELANERARALSEIPFSEWLPDLENPDRAIENKILEPLLMVFQHVANHADIYRILLQNEKSDRTLERIRKIVSQSITEFLQTKVESDPIPILFEVPSELLSAYFSGALLSCVDWWLEQGESYSPEEMTRMFQRLFFPGARNILGVSKTEMD